MKMVIPSLNLDGRTLKNLNSMQVYLTAANDKFANLIEPDCFKLGLRCKAALLYIKQF